MASQSASTRCVCSCRLCGIMTPADSSLDCLSLGAAGLLSCRRVADNVWVLATALSPHKKQQKRRPHTPPAILPCLPADDEHFDGSAPLTNHTEAGGRFAAADRCCGMSARHPWPPAVMSQACCFFCFLFFCALTSLLFDPCCHSSTSSHTTPIHKRLSGSSPTSHRGQLP